MFKPFSASQLKSYDGCQVRWGFERMEGRRGEQGVNAIRGTAVHAELERWYGRKGFAPVLNAKGKNDLRAFLPKLPEACSLMTYVGNVEMLVEVPLSFTRKAAWIGFIDGVIFEGDIVYLIDWKTTGNIQYAMNADQLREDVAANLYAYEAFEGGAGRVILRWIYIEFGSQTPRETRIEMNREDVYAKVGDYDDRAAFANKLKVAHKKGLLNVLDLKKDTSHCHDFKAECSFMAECDPRADRKPLQLRGRNQMSTSDFAAQVNAVTGGERKAPPAIPGKKAPPALPGKKAPALPGKSPVAEAAAHHAGSEPKVESGTVNAPSEGVEAAATPEDAKRIQGIADNVAHEQLSEGEKEQLVDDLETMDVSQLKALATALGIEFTPKARANTVKDLIRSKRAAEAGDELGLSDVAEKIAAQSVDAPLVNAPVETKAAPAAPKAAPKLPTKQVKDADGDAAPSSAGFTLYINCAPENVGTTSLVSILASMAADFKEATGEDDYSAVDFGKGRGIMANGLIDELQNGKVSGHVTVDTATREGHDFCSILVRFANLVIRGR